MPISDDIRLRQACFVGGGNTLGGGVGGGELEACNFSTYIDSNGDPVNVPFVPCGQAYTEGEQITIFGQQMTVLGE